MSKQHLVILCTAPDRPTAQSLAENLVHERLAACVSIVPEVLSVFHWQGKSETEAEVLMIIKTAGDAYQRLEQRLQALHPYELPEIIAVPITNGLAGYLDWVDSSTGATE